MAEAEDRPVCLIQAHPYPAHSRAGRTLIEAVSDLPGIDVRSLYALYPDFDIDVAAEHAALERARLVVWMHPVYWYSVPALLKLWFEQVLGRGWAYGEGGTALRGRHCLWVPTAGGDARAYSAQGVHRRAFEHFQAPVEETALFCGMVWEPPLILLGAERCGDDDLARTAAAFRTRLSAWTVGAAAGAEVR